MGKDFTRECTKLRLWHSHRCCWRSSGPHCSLPAIYMLFQRAVLARENDILVGRGERCNVSLSNRKTRQTFLHRTSICGHTSMIEHTVLSDCCLEVLRGLVLITDVVSCTLQSLAQGSTTGSTAELQNNSIGSWEIYIWPIALPVW